LPLSRAWAKPARTRSRRPLAFELREHRQQCGHGTAGGRGQIKSFGERHESDAEMIQFLQCGKQVGD
jgi:hypothetical protein